MPAPRLLTFADAAQELGVPAKSLRAVADKHGKTVMIGRTPRLHPDDLGELIELCRCQPRALASSCESEKDARPSMPSRTRATPSVQQAQGTADKLKSFSRITSPASSAKVVPLARTK